ncbi:MAG TPA: NADH-ubiquinone oxidoreductase-F iron-sulfur binding region domain-containing protein, partial [Acidimicrobiales bacterium]|nr:NADH-ubiquinone oxidoreductase-F iron-sulfur binding region domain-containing protein [Acidimicrobiales bacterium]
MASASTGPSSSDRGARSRSSGSRVCGGRGGAGFPTARKWRTIAQSRSEAGEHVVVVNAGEGEPGTFKDRALLRANPYQVLEGAVIAALTVGAEKAYVGLKRTFTPEIDRVERAIEELEREGLTAGVELEVVTGPDHYLVGEETALLQVIEGEEPLPRWAKPHLHGLFATGPTAGWSSAPKKDAQPTDDVNPTLVNNVETLAAVPHILRLGPEWFRSIGTEDSPGPVVCTVVGDVLRPVVVEVPMGTPLIELIELHAGGLPEGRYVKAVLPGLSNAVLTGADLETPVSYEGLRDAGSGLGAAGFIVYDDRTNLVEVARLASNFLYVESCGQCPPCKLGSGEITERLDRIARSGGDEGDIETIGARLLTVTDAHRCHLAVQEQELVSSILRRFPQDV